MENTPFDSLDFASEHIGLGGRTAIDATKKLGPEKRHEWGEALCRPKELESKVDARWEELGLSDLENKQPDPTLFGYVIDELLRQSHLSKSQ